MGAPGSRVPRTSRSTTWSSTRRRRRCTCSRPTARPGRCRRWLTGSPQISTDGKTVTVHIKSGWKWSPPVNREITSADVAYAFQRDFNPNVQNGYSSGYYPIVGAAQGGRQADLRHQHAEQHDDRLPPDQGLRRHVRRGTDAAADRRRCRSRWPRRSTRAARRSTTRPDQAGVQRSVHDPELQRGSQHLRSCATRTGAASVDGDPPGVRRQDRVERRRRPDRRGSPDARPAPTC